MEFVMVVVVSQTLFRKNLKTISTSLGSENSLWFIIQQDLDENVPLIPCEKNRACGDSRGADNPCSSARCTGDQARSSSEDPTDTPREGLSRFTSILSCHEGAQAGGQQGELFKVSPWALSIQEG